MEVTKAHTTQQKRFNKLSLKKNRVPKNEEPKKCERTSDIKVFDESFDRIQTQYTNSVQSKVQSSPIVINDSCDDTKDVLLEVKEPSKFGNVSFNSSRNFISPNKPSKPSFDGWSPRQHIICATPKNDTVPSTPNDKADESIEQCSIKRIQSSHHKLLTDLYGETWKSISTLVKTKKQNHENLNGVSKQLHFNDEENDKENIRYEEEKNREWYFTKREELCLTNSETKIRKNSSFEEKRSKKKLYTEKVPSTPDLPKQKPKVKSTMKKVMTVTELVGVMNNDVDLLSKKVKNVTVTPKAEVNRLSFIGSLVDNIPSWRCHPEAIQYHDNYKNLRDQLARRLYIEFNKVVFDNALDADLPILWDTKLRSTAGTTTNRLLKTAKGTKIRSSTIKLSTKVIDAVQRLRDTLIHELCHAATWLIDGELRAGHGPLWKKWAMKALKKFPELGEISRCHDMEIHYKYSYKCTTCGYCIKRHSKSIDITKKCCGYCRGTFQIIVNKKNKDGIVVSTPARKGGLNDFALFVKQNYGLNKNGRTHAEVMKLLGEQFSERKKMSSNIDPSSE